MNSSSVTLLLAFISPPKLEIAHDKVKLRFLKFTKSILGELMWPVDPIAIKSLKFDDEIFLVLYSSISVDIFDVLKGNWLK